MIRLAAQCVAAGADDVGLSNTTGCAAHMHNTRGLGLTNCLAAYDGSGSGFFPMFNRNKKSLALGLQTPEGMEAVLKLIATADIVSENFKLGTMAELSLDYASLKALNPRLI